MMKLIKCLESGRDPNQAILLLLSDSCGIQLALCVKQAVLVWEMQTENRHFLLEIMVPGKESQ